MVSSPVENIIQRYLWLDYRWNWVSNIHDRFHRVRRTLTVHQGVTFRPFKAIPGPPLPDRERRLITRPHVSERTEPRFTCERENLTSRIFARSPANGTRSPRSGNNGKRDKSFPGDRGKGLAAIDSHEHGGTCSNVALRAGIAVQLFAFRSISKVCPPLFVFRP